MSKPYPGQPSAIVQQEFQATPPGVILPQQACIIGPNRLVMGADDVQDRTFIVRGAYVPGADTDYDYAGLPVGGVVDLDNVSLRLEKVLALYADLTGSGSVTRGASANELYIPSALGFQNYNNGATQFLRNTAFVNRDVKIGDRVKITPVANPSKVLTTRITAFRNATVAATVAPPTSATNPPTVAYSGSVVETNDQGTDHLPTVFTGTSSYRGDITKGVLNDVYVLEVITAGAPATAVFKVTSTNGDNVASVASVAFGTAFNVGTRGLQAKIASTGSQAFIVGEIYTFTVQAAYTNGGPTRTTGASVYDGRFDTVYKLKVVKGGLWADGPQIMVTTSTGIDQGGPVVVDYNVSFPLGQLGITVRFASNYSSTQGGLVLGDEYFVVVTASKKGAVRTAILAAPLDALVADGDVLNCKFMLYRDRVEIPKRGYPEYSSVALTPAADKFTVASGIEIFDPSWTQNDGVTLQAIPVQAATVVVPYTALLTANSNVLSSLSTLSVLTSVLGKNVVANPLAYAVGKALENAGGQPVWFIPLASDDLEGYRAALEQLEINPDPYFRVALTDDLEILDLVKGHILAETSDKVGNRCAGICSTRLDVVALKYSKKSNGDNWTGYVAVEPGSNPAVYTRVTVPGAAFVTDGIRPGDVVRSNFDLDALGNTIYSSAVISLVTDEENLVLVSPGFAAAIGDVDHLQRIQVVRTLTRDEQSVVEGAQSGAFKTRHMFNVFPDFPIEVDGYFAAAAVAGLASSVVPHQPITNYTVNGFDEQNGSQRRFTPTQLNVMAEGGTLILTQAAKGGAIFVRHQLSTDNTDDLMSELSVKRNVDSISAYLLQGLKVFVGKYNITDNFLQLLDVQLRQRLNNLVASTATPSAGPQIISWEQASLIIKQDPVVRTKVNIKVTVVIPMPANEIVLDLLVTA